MKKILFTFLLFLLSYSWSFSQNHVGIGTSLPDTNAILDLQATNKGILIPRLSALQRNNMSPALGLNQKGLMVFDTDSTKFFYWNGYSWQTFGSGTMGPAGPTGPPCGNTILHYNFTDTASSATTAVQILRSWTLPANTLINNGSYIEIEVFGTIVHQTQWPLFQIGVGGILVGTFNPNIAYSPANFIINARMYRVSGTYSKFTMYGLAETFIPYINVTTGVLNLSANQTLMFVFKDQVVGGNQIVVNGFTVRKVE
jgi:hypothetical protein